MNNSTNYETKPPMAAKYRTSKSFSAFLDGITLGVVGVLVIVIGMLYMTQINVNTDINLLQLGLESGILYGATVSIYLLLRSFSRRKGIATDAWGNAYAAVERNNDWIVSKGIANKTTEYCRAWEKSELEDSRERILADAGITLTDFNEKYLKYTIKEIKKKYPSLSEFEFKTICRAKHTKRLHYNEDYLSVFNKYGKRKAPSQRMTTSTMEKLTVVRILITTAITSVFGVSMVLQLITDFSLATVVMCLVKIIIILIFGTVGMVGGYNMTAVRAVEEMNTKVDEQNRFIKWCGIDLPPKESVTEKETA